MESSRDLKSLVRGWLQASPNIGRVKLAPSPLPSALSPRPERLGLGAVPPADPKTQTYNKQLERRIRRKVMGQRVGQFSTEMGCSTEEKGLHCVLSEEECSRSASVHAKNHPFQNGTMASAQNDSFKNKRKRKKKKKNNAPNAVSVPLVSSDSHTQTVVSEDPLPQRRVDVLRGGSLCGLQTDTTPFSAKQLVSVRSPEDNGSDQVAVKRDHRGTHSEEGEAVFAESISSRLCESASKKKKKRCCHNRRRYSWRSVKRTQLVPWSRKSLKHRPRRQWHAQLRKRL